MDRVEVHSWGDGCVSRSTGEKRDCNCARVRAIWDRACWVGKDLLSSSGWKDGLQLPPLLTAV